MHFLGRAREWAPPQGLTALRLEVVSAASAFGGFLLTKNVLCQFKTERALP